VLVRIDGAGCSHQVVNYLHARAMSYSVEFTLPQHTPKLLELVPDSAWTPAYDAHDEVRDGAWVAELTDLLDLTSTGWPAGMRVIVGKERPHPGAQLRITDIDGHRITAFATNTPAGGPGTQLPELELRYRRRARAKDRFRCAKDSGLANLPLHEFTQNQIYCAIVALACEITTWMQLLALSGHQARRWEPKRLRLRLLSIAGQLATTARHRTLHLSTHAPWTRLALHALTTLRALTGRPAPSG
jgi:Transposase DDE domain group 1